MKSCSTLKKKTTFPGFMFEITRVVLSTYSDVIIWDEVWIALFLWFSRAHVTLPSWQARNRVDREERDVLSNLTVKILFGFFRTCALFLFDGYRSSIRTCNWLFFVNVSFIFLHRVVVRVRSEFVSFRVQFFLRFEFLMLLSLCTDNATTEPRCSVKF